jgi:hypothetical protein
VGPCEAEHWRTSRGIYDSQNRGCRCRRVLNEHCSRFRATGQYSFLIGDAEDLGHITEVAEFNKVDPAAIIGAALKVNTDRWIAVRQEERESYGLVLDELLGEWPDEIFDPGSIGIPTNVLTRKIKPEVFIGFAKIEESWQLPAFVKYGAWNDCPEAEFHCAFHRRWQQRFAGLSGDVVECVVTNPPTDRKTATALAWEQFWYCTDIVDQGCESISNLGGHAVELALLVLLVGLTSSRHLAPLRMRSAMKYIKRRWMHLSPDAPSISTASSTRSGGRRGRSRFSQPAGLGLRAPANRRLQRDSDPPRFPITFGPRRVANHPRAKVAILG